MNKEKRVFFGLQENVFITGLVSLFMDISSEMIYPLVPLFLSNVLGVNKSIIGLIEGIAESTASLLRVFSGWFSDRAGRRKDFMVLGYGISTLSRPIMAVAGGWHTVFGARFIDRFGKGIRTAPRDAIIAEATETAFLGRAYSFQRSMDTMGAVIGPALAFFFLAFFSNDYRRVFWLSVIPGVIAVLLIILFITEEKSFQIGAQRPKLRLSRFDGRFKFFVFITALFAVGNSSDVFLILRAQHVGIPAVMIPVVYLFFNIVYSVSAIPAGIAADRFGKGRLLFVGFVLFAIVYTGFGLAKDVTIVWVLFGFYGLFMGLADGTQRAFLATIIPADFKATAFGIYHTVVGLALFPASLIGGWLWDHVSPSATFYYGASTAVLSALLFVVFLITTKRAGLK
ncbi:MAG TPA: MFS transporter [Thermodesulfovibrionales bacterium]|nr:MFS transporter [Thermodesulfovibrionales bacterium]